MTSINNPPGLGVVLTAVVEISSAEILALFTTPKVLVVGVAGTLIRVAGISLFYDKGAVNYTIVGTGHLGVYYKNGATYTLITTENTNSDLLSQAQDYVTPFIQANTSKLVAANVVGRDLVLKCASADPAAGNGTIHAKVSYYLDASGL